MSHIFVSYTLNLQQSVAKRATGIQNRKTTSQPFNIFVGSLDGVVQSSVQINNVTYDICTPEMAIDLRFKARFALNAQYQEECRNIWTFIERKVNEMQITGNDYIDVNKLISAINLVEV